MPPSDLTRRDLLISGAVAAGYALAARPITAETITTDADGLVTGTAQIPTSDGEIGAYYARPDRPGRVPVVLVVHEIFGVHAYIQDVCRRLAQDGYFAIAPDLYQRHGDASKLDSVDQILLSIVVKVPDALVLSDLDATLAWVGAEGHGDVERAAITGFCWGGRIVWLYAAHNASLRAGAAWYGRLVGEVGENTPRHPTDVAESLHAPVLGLYGAEDRGIPGPTVDAMQAKLQAAGGTSEITVFPGAPHGFHADYRSSYRSLAASEAWRRMLAWFRRHGV